ncbi:uncharacterized protein Bfra_003778 [Botrytis fragariae]|uniref:2EXR domain-containing protein n=1 Tax=Botrytis fragariae TaxID=1964551 RepID=A0A8H6AXC5_9HELO|nr:uncharacterized protein Bfra_003778 [Botrytis fragariae]KAF5875323.1 hypothetical protein Bfra_003778 [Botrytis fragariae]
MSYSFFNHSAGATSHKRSLMPNANDRGLSSFEEEQQEECSDSSITRESPRNKQCRRSPPPPRPNYSIVPSTINLEQQSHKPHLDTFPKFMDLPLELRIKIYEFASLEPRAVPIWPVYTDRKNDDVEFRFASETPAIMQVCHEARRESQKLDIYAPTSDTPSPLPRIWLKPSIDIVCPVRNGSPIWTVFQFLKFSQMINRFNIERLCIDSFEFQCSQLTDNLHTFVVIPKWMNHSLRQILAYSSLHPINIRRQPLRIVSSTRVNLERDSEEVMLHSMEADSRFEELEDLMGNLSSLQSAQNELDKMTGERLVHMPSWLYKHRTTWTQPELICCAAL